MYIINPLISANVFYLNWVDFKYFSFSTFYVQRLYASFRNYKSANLTNECISWITEIINPSK